MSNTSSNTTKKSNSSAKTAAKSTTAKPEAKVQKTFNLEEIEQRNEFLNSLFEKRAKLRQSQLKLEKFHLSSDDFSVRLELRDNIGNSFTTAHVETISRTIKAINDDIQNAIIEVESHIKSIFA